MILLTSLYSTSESAVCLLTIAANSWTAAIVLALSVIASTVPSFVPAPSVTVSAAAVGVLTVVVVVL